MCVDNQLELTSFLCAECDFWQRMALMIMINRITITSDSIPMTTTSDDDSPSVALSVSKHESEEK